MGLEIYGRHTLCTLDLSAMDPHGLTVHAQDRLDKKYIGRRSHIDSSSIASSTVSVCAGKKLPETMTLGYCIEQTGSDI